MHIARRNGRREDPRYADIAARAPGSPAAHLYRRVYLVQAAAMWVVSLPVQVAAHQDGPLTASGALVVTVAVVVVWAVGLFFEAVGDAQPARFTADPANAGRVDDAACGVTPATPTASATPASGGACSCRRPGTGRTGSSWSLPC